MSSTINIVCPKEGQAMEVSAYLVSEFDLRWDSGPAMRSTLGLWVDFDGERIGVYSNTRLSALVSHLRSEYGEEPRLTYSQWLADKDCNVPRGY